MTDGGKKNSAMLDKTKPVPVPRGQTKDPSTEEQDGPAFLGEQHEAATDPMGDAMGGRPATSSPTDDTVVRPGKQPLDSAPAISLEGSGEGSFDDDLAKQKVAPRLPTLARAVPAAVPETVDVMPPPQVPAPLPSSVFASGPSLKAAGPPSPEQRTEIAERSAPVADAADAESIATAPIPMISGLHARDLRDDEPSLPQQRQGPSEHATSPSRPAPREGAPTERAVDETVLSSEFPLNNSIDSELVGLVLGDGIERLPRGPTGPPPPTAADAPVEHTLEHTPLETVIVPRPRVTSEENAPSPEAVLANDETRLKQSPAQPRARLTLPIAAFIGAAAGLLVVGAIVLALRAARADVAEELATSAASAPPTQAPPTQAPPTQAPPTQAPPTQAPPLAGTSLPPPAAVTPPLAVTTPVTPVATPDPPVTTLEPATAAATAPASEAGATPAPSGTTRRKDGFGPFLNRSGSNVSGLTQALGRGLRATLGEGAFTTGTWVGLGVRGEVRRAVAKGKPLAAAVDCALSVVDEKGARAFLSATGTALDDGSGREATLRNAADRCGRALESDLRGALDRLRP